MWIHVEKTLGIPDTVAVNHHHPTIIQADCIVTASHVNAQRTVIVPEMVPLTATTLRTCIVLQRLIGKESKSSNQDKIR